MTRPVRSPSLPEVMSDPRARLPQYPVHEILPELRRALSPSGAAAVLEAPPGAGKSTLVPLELLRDSDIIAPGDRIVMLEPRRLAARSVATRMADLLGEQPGASVGYRVRFESRVSERTRIEVVTEGILTRRIQSDPELAGVSLVIFDEFHERNLHGDLALALCLEARVLREDLRILVMSATLEDTAPAVSKLLAQSGGDAAPILVSEGRMHPVEVRHLRELAIPDGRLYPAAIAERMLPAILEALQAGPANHTAANDSDGDLLVFLPGAGEIRRVERALRDSRDPALADCAIYPLYGDLSRDAQTAALAPDPRGRRKIILATPIAETSLTIEGVRQVVDSGLRRAPRYEASTGLSRLQLLRISRASAAQRAGRAGRLGPGRAYRLWSEHDHDRLEARTRPEILDADLAPLLLELAAWGVPITPHRPLPLAFLDAPPPAHLSRAATLLHQLGALEATPQSRNDETRDDATNDDEALSYRITEAGRAMVRLPVHPRLARMLLIAASPEPINANANVNLLSALSAKLQSDQTYRTAVAADLAAILSERDPLAAASGNRRLSIVARLEGLLAYRSPGGGSHSGDAQIYRAIDQTARQLRKLIHARENRSESAAASADSERGRRSASYAMPGPFDPGALLAVAYPDRIALARSTQPASGRYRLSSGGGAVLSVRNDAANPGSRAGSPAYAPVPAEAEEIPEALVVLDLAPPDSRGSGSAKKQAPGESTIRLQAPLAPESIETIFADQLIRERTVVWDASAARVQSREELRFGSLVLATRPFTETEDPAGDPKQSTGVSAKDGLADYATQLRAAFLDGLREIMKRGGTAALAANDTDRESFERLRARLLFLRDRTEILPESIPGLAGDAGLPDFSEESLVAHPEDWLGDFIVGHQSFSSFRKGFRLMDAVHARLPYATMTWLDEAAPTHIEVPSGSRIRLEYGEGECVLAVKLQELFGLRKTPRVALGRESVTLHLLSPARRPIQVTRDLAGFWERTYGDVKKELKGRYPKHPWPDDPFDPIEAVATRHTKKRRS